MSGKDAELEGIYRSVASIEVGRKIQPDQKVDNYKARNPT